jgi:hypothetical protein
MLQSDAVIWFQRCDLKRGSISLARQIDVLKLLKISRKTISYSATCDNNLAWKSHKNLVINIKSRTWDIIGSMDDIGQAICNVIVM